MRADMGKVLVERPRIGHSDRNRKKGYRKATAKALAADGGPTREGMKARTPRSKHFNEHLGPLRRFLDSNVGRPWDKVHAEIRERVNPDNVVQKHVLTHLDDYVVTQVIEVDGEPVDANPRFAFFGGRTRSLRTSYAPQWYVCPRSGLLRRSRLVRRKYRPEQPPAPRRVRVSRTEVCLELDGRWELVTLAALPDPKAVGWRFDVVLGRNIGVDGVCDLVRLYGARAYATARRPLSRAEQKRLPIPIDWVK
ncbi:hypothetical protein J0H58_18070 [bacterium]|nr:hypothetical protein [bacterium]